ncbi:MAG: N-acetyl-alpha-D-glucosaminyl L-malate synthase BshA [Planctomycetota bacterium]
MNARDDRLRIGIACWPTYGGSGVLATELAIALADEGHEVHLLSYEAPIRLPEFRGNLFYHRVGVPEYPLFKYPPYALALATRMAEVAEQHRLDLIHAHYAIPHSVSAILARDMVGRHLKVITTLHGTDITIVGNDSSYSRITRYSIDRADGVTAVSAWLAEETRRTFGTTREIVEIPNFVDLDRFSARPCAQAQALKRGDEPLLMHVSNFRRVKRVTELVEAFAAVVATDPARLVMVGDGPELGRAERLASELGVADRIHFLGSQDAVEKILPCADLFLLPSRFESFGLAALEAMACGVPVLASRAGGLPELVEEGETGGLFDLEVPGDLATKLRAMLRQPERLAAMGHEARRRAEERYALPRVLPRYVDLYRSVMDQPAG